MTAELEQISFLSYRLVFGFGQFVGGARFIVREIEQDRIDFVWIEAGRADTRSIWGRAICNSFSSRANAPRSHPAFAGSALSASA
jgi:hypothetical protein